MALTLEIIDHIAALSRLALTDEEKARFVVQLSAVLEYFRKLQELDTAGVPPTSGVLPGLIQLRPDEPRPGITLEELSRTASEMESGQFKVPPVLP